jgi:glycosyltransferase involved in cell wall biosynthesis
MRIAIVKPDHGIVGGFERVLQPVIGHLEQCGHRVDVMGVDVTMPVRDPYGVPVPASMRPGFNGCIEYFARVEQFSEIRTRLADLVISTQPPSFAVDHPRHLALFYHHSRAYYDLAEIAIEGGMVDRAVHEIAVPRVRALDQVLLGRVKHFLAGSHDVVDRLATFNGFTDNVTVFEAGLVTGDQLPEPRDTDRFATPLCVSRHEFPKRTELFVHAMGLLHDADGQMVGAGGRLGWVQQLATSMADGKLDPAALGDHSTWLCQPGFIPPQDGVVSNKAVTLRGWLDDDALDAAYRQALCVVAPAYREDYGLTALEAMAYGKPVVVCRDGGGLTSFVQHDVTGLVVEPTATAIAAAVDRLRNDLALAERLGAAAREAVRTYTWSRALSQLDDAVERVMS